jgi:hypothetical protein
MLGARRIPVKTICSAGDSINHAAQLRQARTLRPTPAGNRFAA